MKDNNQISSSKLFSQKYSQYDSRIVQDQSLILLAVNHYIADSYLFDLELNCCCPLLLQTASISVITVLIRFFHQEYSQVNYFRSQRYLYSPSCLILTQNCFPSSEWSSQIKLVAYYWPGSQLRAEVSPQRYSYQIHWADEMLRAASIITASVSCALKKVHLRVLFATLAILSSKSLSILFTLPVLIASAKSNVNLKKLYQQCKCLRLRQSSSLKPNSGIGLPRYLSTVRVSYRELITERFMLLSEMLNTFAIFLMKGKQVRFISLYVQSCLIQFFCNYLSQSLQSVIKMSSFMTRGIVLTPEGRAQTFSWASEVLENGGRRQDQLTLISFQPVPRGQSPQS